MTALTPASLVSRLNDVLAASVGDGYVLLNHDASRYVDLNASAAVIWDLIEIPRTVESICEAVRVRFEISQEQCEDDVQATLLRLIELQVVRIDA